MSQPVDFSVDGWKQFIAGKIALTLSGLNLIDSQITTLAEVLKADTTVQRIDLSDNKITALGAKALADVLRVNQVIAGNPMLATSAIKIGSNPIGKEGFLAITRALVESGRAGYCLDFDEEIGISEEDCEEVINDPSLAELKRRTEECRSVLYPSGDCMLM